MRIRKDSAQVKASHTAMEGVEKARIAKMPTHNDLLAGNRQQNSEMRTMQDQNTASVHLRLFLKYLQLC